MLDRGKTLKLPKTLVVGSMVAWSSASFTFTAVAVTEDEKQLSRLQMLGYIAEEVGTCLEETLSGRSGAETSASGAAEDL